MFKSILKRKKKRFTPYEAKALQEIREWEKKGPGFIMKAMDMVTKPVSLIIDLVPGPVIEGITKAIMGFMEMLKDISFWTYSHKNIVKTARAVGLDVDSISDLFGHDLQLLDRVARRYCSSNKILAALQGAGCGLGGLALIAADIPALFTIGFRSVQQIGASYGFDMQDPEMISVILSVFNIGSGTSAAVKSATIADMQLTARALVQDIPLELIAKRTHTGAVIEMMKKSSGEVSRQMAESISRRKLGQAIPLVGAAISAGFNYWFMSNTVISAYMIFRKLYIEKKYLSK